MNDPVVSIFPPLAEGVIRDSRLAQIEETLETLVLNQLEES